MFPVRYGLDLYIYSSYELRASECWYYMFSVIELVLLLKSVLQCNENPELYVCKIIESITILGRTKNF
jgi:hypothetical protein